MQRAYFVRDKIYPKNLPDLYALNIAQSHDDYPVIKLILGKRKV